MYRRQPHLPPIPPMLLWNRTTPGRDFLVAVIGLEPTLSTGMNRVCYHYTKLLYEDFLFFTIHYRTKKTTRDHTLLECSLVFLLDVVCEGLYSDNNSLLNASFRVADVTTDFPIRFAVYVAVKDYRPIERF